MALTYRGDRTGPLPSADSAACPRRARVTPGDRGRVEFERFTARHRQLVIIIIIGVNIVAGQGAFLKHRPPMAGYSTVRAESVLALVGALLSI